MKSRTIFALIFIALCSCSGDRTSAPTDESGTTGPFDSTALSEFIEQTRVEYALPAIGVLISEVDKEPLIAVSGVRKLGEVEPVSDSDYWFIGSATKPITAVLLATFVQEGTVSFATPLLEVFPEYADKFTSETETITLKQLLNHSSGLPPNPVSSARELAALTGPDESAREQRKKILIKSISEKLVFPPGSKTAYSNTAYILAGAVIEKLGKDNFRKLLAVRVFKPLGISDYGFGQPASPTNDGQIDQPWGHHSSFFRLKPTAPNDPKLVNPPIFDPAGGIYISLRGWARYLRDELNGRRGNGLLLEQSVYEKMHMPAGGKSGFGLGWGALVEDNTPVMLTHNGSDGNWFADVRLYTKADIILLTVTNDGREDDEAKAASKHIRKSFNQRYTPF